MWIYQTQTDKKCGPSSFSLRPPAPAKRAECPPAAIPPSNQKKVSLFYMILFGCSYLTGELFGCLMHRTFEGSLQDFARYLYQTSLSLYTNKSLFQLFGVKFISCFCLFSFIALMGFCTFGAPVLFGTAFVKGFSSGVFFLQLLQDPLQKGFIASLLIFWPPELLGCLFMIGLLNSAFRGSAALFKTSLGGRAHNLSGLQRRLLRQYLSSCLGAVLPSAASVFLCQLFSFVLV